MKMDSIDLGIYCEGVRGEMAAAISAIAHHEVMHKIRWTNLQACRSAEIGHAEILIAVVLDDYHDDMTAAEARNAIVTDDEIGDYAAMLTYYRMTADRIADALAPYAETAASDPASRHVLASLRKRHVWAHVCREAEAYPRERLEDALGMLYAEGEREVAFTC